MTDHDKQETFFSRWSRRKQQTTEPESPETTDELPVDAEVTSETGQAHDLPSQADQPTPLTDTDMPDIESLDEHSDYSGFMSPEVSDSLRKVALRKLFQGEAFNLRDGLDDYDDDFTRFTPLGDMITCDMKHQMQVTAERQLDDSLSTRDPTMPMTPKQQALASLETFTPAPTGQVEYHSHGHVLIIGDESALHLATRLPDSLQASVVLTNDQAEFSDSTIITYQNNREISLQGWLGDFTLSLTGTDATPQTLKADLVVDLTDTPLITAQVTPPGYFSHQHTPLETMLQELTPLEGQFAKPRFFDYNSDICAHSRSGLTGCTRCIDACPTDAIISIGDKIQVEPHLCQGGGTCATACPTGAIRYNYPAPDFQINQIRRLLKSYQNAGGEQPVLLFHAHETRFDAEQLSERVIPYPLEELASAGADLWAASLSFGATQVLLLDDDNTPPLSRQFLRQQINILNTQLAGLGYSDDSVRLIPAISENDSTVLQTLEQNGQPLPHIPPAAHAGLNNKRQQWMLALDHFYKHAPQPQDQITLPTGSPFGTLKVDKEACTLCMACATVCPAKALSGGTDSPRLKLHPANCVQCGLCESGCPEQAITLQPQFISNRELRNRPITLNEEKPFHCIDCGKPFASHRMITNMLAKLEGHAMFSGERAKNRLKKCEDCRVIDVVQDEQAMGQPGLGDPAGGSLRH